VEEDAAFEQRAVEVGDKRTDVARRIRAAGRPGSEQGQVTLVWLGEAVRVGFVYRIDRARWRHLNIGMAEDKGPDGRVEREAVDTVARGEHQHGGRSVEDVTGRQLPRARLQHVLPWIARARSGRVAAQDGKDRADAHVDVDVAGAVERIEDDDVLALGRVALDDDRLLVFLGRRDADVAPRAAAVHAG